MLIFFVLIAILGAFNILKPKFIWLLLESWKSEDATEPSDFYIFTTRLSGIILLVIGIGCTVALLIISAFS